MMLLTATILCLILALAVFAFLIVLYNYHQDKRTERHNTLYRFNPDYNGNYPVYFDLAERYYRPEPGNPGHPGSYQVNVQPPNRHYYHDVPIVVNSGSKQLPKEPEPEQLPPASRNFIEAVSSEISEISPEIRDLLTAAKRRGEGKTAALRSVGINPGKSKDYIFWSKEWEVL